MLQTAVRLLWLFKVHRHDHKSRYLTQFHASSHHKASYRGYRGGLTPYGDVSERPAASICSHDGAGTQTSAVTSQQSSSSPSSQSLPFFHLKHYFVSLKASMTTSRHLTLSDPTWDLVRQYDFPVLFRCRKTSDAVFVAFVRPLSEPVRRFFSCSTDFSQQMAQVVLFLFLHVFLF
jgi:hypothetical protein